MAIKKEIELNVDTSQAQTNVEDLNNDIKETGKTAEKTGKESKKGFEDGAKGAKSLKSGIQGIGVAFKALGIGILIGLFAKLAQVFSENQKVADALATVSESLSIVFNDLINFLIDSYDDVVNFFKAIFEDPQQSIEDLGNLIKNNLIERFTSLLEVSGLVGKAIKQLFAGDFSEAFETAKQAGKELVDVATGVDGAYDKIKDGVESAASAISDYAKETYDSAKANVELKNTAILAEAQLQGLVEKYGRQSEQLRQIRDNDRLTIAERIEANEELGRVLDEQAEAQKRLAQIGVAAANAEIKKTGGSIEAQKQLQEALNEVAAIEAQVEGFRSEQLTNRNSLLREQEEILKNLQQIGKDDFEQAKLEAELEREERLNQIELAVEDERTKKELLLEVENDYQASLKAIEEEQLKREEEQANKREEIRRKNLEAQQEIEKKKREAQAATLSATADAIYLSEQLLGEGTAAAKVAGIARATIDTYQAANTALATLPPPASFIAAATSIATGLLNVKEILKVKVPNGKGGGSAPSASAPTPPAFNTVGNSGVNQVQTGVEQQAEQPIRAYVVSGEVTTAQEAERNTIDNASF